jgi:nucleobase transporter 1/2
VQGPSFVYLAPALAIINSPEFFGLNDNVSIFSFHHLCYGDAAWIACHRHMLQWGACDISFSAPLGWINIICSIASQNFKHIMKHLQGAIIIGGSFQVLLGYTGLMSILLRFVSLAAHKTQTVFFYSFLPPLGRSIC